MLRSAPHNPVTGTKYKGRNREILRREQIRQEYTSSCWYTYRNALGIDRPVRRGETATQIHIRSGRCYSLFNEDQLVPVAGASNVALERLDIETDAGVEWASLLRGDRSNQLLQQILLELRLQRIERELQRILQYQEDC